jgi:hypothetical protein
MTNVNDSRRMLRVVVKLRPEQYDDLVRHVNEVGSTLSAFFRASAVKAMNEARVGEPSADGLEVERGPRRKASNQAAN